MCCTTLLNLHSTPPTYFDIWGPSAVACADVHLGDIDMLGGWCCFDDIAPISDEGVESNDTVTIQP